MKGIISFIICLFCLLAAKAQPVQFERNTHNFGQIFEQNGNATHEFKFKNTSNAPVTISRVGASCGCTTPDWSKEPIPPGGEGFVKAEYNPLGRPGPFEKYLTVTIDGYPNNIELMIEGEVVPGKGRVRPKPYSYLKYFGYNRSDIAKDELSFMNLVDKTIDLLVNFGEASLSIESSASKVPTKAFDNNEQLAKIRAMEAEARLLAALKAKGVSAEKLKILPHTTKVQGPEYKDDFDQNKPTYEKYQYVKITVE
jgi:hypothetical protein